VSLETAVDTVGPVLPLRRDQLLELIPAHLRHNAGPTG
jgi:hypothetical protein